MSFPTPQSSNSLNYVSAPVLHSKRGLSRYRARMAPTIFKSFCRIGRCAAAAAARTHDAPRKQPLLLLRVLRSRDACVFSVCTHAAPYEAPYETPDEAPWHTGDCAHYLGLGHRGLEISGHHSPRWTRMCGLFDTCGVFGPANSGHHLPSRDKIVGTISGHHPPFGGKIVGTMRGQLPRGKPRPTYATPVA